MEKPCLTLQPCTDPDPCTAIKCPKIGEPIEVCRDHRCPHRWQREGKERRERDAERDRKERVRYEA